tara:strand:- start:881 stop:1606 length:726 start_codon:yes stop_codon:yes gene_type:complete
MEEDSGDNIKTYKSGWDFKTLNPQNFEKHVNKSVPGYSHGHKIITLLSDYFISQGSIIYDIGCSTGNLISQLSLYHHKREDLQFIGIEPANNFSELFIENTKNKSSEHKFEFVNCNVQDYEFEKFDMAVAYYSIQFIHPKYRQELISRIYDNLNWGGAFFFFEKVRGTDSRFHDMLNSLYFEYKKEMGYTNDEIINKMMSLKGVLEPYTSNENNNFLKRAGFKDTSIIFKNLCFEGLLAIK